MIFAHGSNGNNLFRSTQPLGVWINGLLFVEFVYRLVLLRLVKDHQHADVSLDVIRSIAWGLLALSLGWRWICQHPSLWWALDYVPRLPTWRAGSALWLLCCPERWTAVAAVDGLCLRRQISSRWSAACVYVIRDLMSKIGGVCSSAVSRFSPQIIEYLPFLRRPTPQPEEQEIQEELFEAGPSQIFMERREIELIDISRHSKQA